MKTVTYTFTVPGPLLAYRKSTIPVRGRRFRVNDPKYNAFKEKVLLCAMEQGFRRRRTTKENPAWLSVNIRWKKNPRLDGSNVLKGVEDALYEQDRWVTHGRFSANHNFGTEEAIVTITEGGE